MSAPVSSPVFVGRASHLARLAEALDGAADADGSTTLLAGESGIGKSRLVAELTSRARDRGFTVLIGECLELAEGELPYAALVSAFRSLLPELQTGAGNVPEGGPGLDGAQSRLFEQLLATLARLGDEAPVLLVIEDLHWADRSTRDFLSFLVRNARRERLALVATYRTDDLHRRHPLRPFVLELERSGQATRLDLGPLDAGEMREQLTAIAGTEPDPELLERLLALSDGNPFFAEELLAVSASPGAALPASLRDALLLRVESLSPAAQSLLRIAAVAGRTIDHSLLAAVSRSTEGDLNQALREAISGYVLAQDQSSPGYRFRHALLREAVYEDLLPGERRALHVSLAEALAARPELGSGAAGTAAEIAYHWYAAHEMAAALPAAVAAGVAAEAARALAEASLHFQRALEIWDAAGPGVESPPLSRLEVTRRAAEAENLAGDSARATALARAALDLVDAERDPVTAALIQERIGRYVWTEGRGEAAVAEYRRAIELMPAEPPSAERALVLAAFAQVLMLANRFAECLPPCEEALAIAREVDAPSIEAHALNTLTATYSHRGEQRRGVEATAEAREIANRLGLVEEICRSYVNGSDALDQAGLVEESIELAREGIESARELGAGRGFGDFLQAEIAMRLLRSGRWAEAERTLTEIDRGRPTGIIEGQVRSQLAQLRADRGELEEAAADAARARELVVRSGGVMWLAPLHVAEATVALWRGEPAAAATTIDLCLETVAGVETSFFTAPLYEAGTRASADAGERTAERAVREREMVRGRALIARFDALLAAVPGEPAPAALAARATCAAELTRLSGEDGAEAWRLARARWQALGDSYRAAYAGWRGAEAVLIAAGERGEAEALTREALAIARELGAAPLVAELEALARRGRLELDGLAEVDGVPKGLAELDLTPRETEVLARLAEGMTNREIAEELFISQKTASVHVSHILAKLGVRNRAEATAFAHRLGVG